MIKLYKWLAAAVLIVLLPISGVVAADKPLLTISGNVTKMVADGKVQLSREALEAMPRTTFTTSTIWTEGEREFSGVALVDLVEAVGANGSTMKATALNNYAVDVPMADAVKGGPIIAYELDGKRMSVREKGPLWLVYPYDSNATYRTETIYSRSIWQLDRLEIIE